MTTENSFNKITHTNSSDVTYKNSQCSPSILKEVFDCINEGNYKGLINLLEQNDELAGKSLNIYLCKAFHLYHSNNKGSKEIIIILLK
jgi:hypothetical protein